MEHDITEGLIIDTDAAEVIGAAIDAAIAALDAAIEAHSVPAKS